MSGLAWLNDLMVWLGRWFPRLVLVKIGHAGVWFGPAGRCRRLYPGLHWYWPMTSDLTVVSVRERSTEIACQLHGREAISIAVFFEITDPQTMLVSQNDIFSMLDDRAQGFLAAAYAPETSNHALSASVLRNLQSEFAQHGVNVRSVSVLQRGRVIPLKNLNDWAQHAKAEL